MTSKFYMKLVKRAQRFLRNRFMRRWFPWLVELLKPLFRREYWLPEPHRMALGLAIGLFCAFALMFVPLQMVSESFICLLLRANLPMALGACWITNPATWLVLIPLSNWFGKLVAFIPLPEFLVSGLLSFSSQIDSWASSFGVSLGDSAYHFLVGSVSLGIVSSVLVYPIFRFTWIMFSKRGLG